MDAPLFKKYPDPSPGKMTWLWLLWQKLGVEVLGVFIYHILSPIGWGLWNYSVIGFWQLCVCKCNWLGKTPWCSLCGYATRERAPCVMRFLCEENIGEDLWTGVGWLVRVNKVLKRLTVHIFKLRKFLEPLKAVRRKTLQDTIPKAVITPTYLTGGSIFLRLLLVSLHSVCRSGGISNGPLIFIPSIWIFATQVVNLDSLSHTTNWSCGKAFRKVRGNGRCICMEQPYIGIWPRVQVNLWSL